MRADAVFDVPEVERPRLADVVDGVGKGRPVAVRTTTGDIELPPSAGRAVLALLGQLAEGGAVHLVSADSELTTQHGRPARHLSDLRGAAG